jgi:amidase
MQHAEYLRHDATALAAAVAAGAVQPAGLLALAQAQAARVQPRLGGLLRELPELAAQQLARLQRSEPAGPLRGVPLLLKDSVLDIAGVPTTYGSRALQRHVPARHAHAVQRWLDAGAVIFGKTNLPELGLKGISDSAAYGAVGNPWDPARNAGGSSGGSAAMVAAGVVPMAGGNDGGGSLRIPAALCGLFALKPSRGRIGNGPALGEVWFGACSEGVISRSVRDTALALDILCRSESRDPGDPFAAPPSPPMPWRTLAQQPPGRLRVAFSTTSPIGTPVDVQAVAAVHDAVALLRSLGHAVEEAAPALDGTAVARAYLALYFGYAAATLRWARTLGARDAEFELATRVIATLGEGMGAAEFATELMTWNTHARALAGFLQTHDLWLTPTVAAPAPLQGAYAFPPAQQRLLAALLGSGVLRALAGWRPARRLIDADVLRNLAPFPFTQLANLTGVPAINVPLYWTPQGLPLGVQFIARMGDEALLLQLATQLEQARPWFDRLPPIATEAS